MVLGPLVIEFGSLYCNMYGYKNYEQKETRFTYMSGKPLTFLGLISLKFVLLYHVLML